MTGYAIANPEWLPSLIANVTLAARSTPNWATGLVAGAGLAVVFHEVTGQILGCALDVESGCIWDANDMSQMIKQLGVPTGLGVMAWSAYQLLSAEEDHPATPSAGSGAGATKTMDPPGRDPLNPAGDGWEWKGNGPEGSSEGSWVRKGADRIEESMHPDLDHAAPEGPHWDRNTDPRDPLHRDGWRVDPDTGAMTPK